MPLISKEELEKLTTEERQESQKLSDLKEEYKKLSETVASPSAAAPVPSHKSNLNYPKKAEEPKAIASQNSLSNKKVLTKKKKDTDSPATSSCSCTILWI